MIAITLLGIESIMLYFLYKKYGIASGIVIVFLIVYFYCNSVVADVLLFKNISESFKGAVLINANDIAFDLTCISYFLFLGTYFICFYFFYKNETPQKQLLFRIGKGVVVFFIIVLIGYIYRNISVTRDEIKGTGNLVSQTINIFLWLFYIFITFSASFNSKNLRIILNVVFILFCIFSYEREPVVLLLMVFLFKRSKINLLYAIPLGIIAIVILSYFKAFYGFVLNMGNVDLFFLYVKNNPIVLSNLDPLPSFALIYDYFKGVNIYDKYDFSYITSIIEQIPVYFEDAPKIVSQGQKLSMYYVDGNYGVAFSMILESLLNFSYFGPIFLAIISFKFYQLMFSLFRKFPELINIIFIMFFLSFVRTELIVMIKVYIFPVTIFLIMLLFICKIYPNSFVFTKNKNYK